MSKLPKEKTSVVTILRNPVDRVFSTYEFSVEVAARFLVHPNLTSATRMAGRLRSKTKGISTLDIWPWKYLVPWMREDLFSRVRFFYSDCSLHLELCAYIVNFAVASLLWMIKWKYLFIARVSGSFTQIIICMNIMYLWDTVTYFNSGRLRHYVNILHSLLVCKSCSYSITCIQCCNRVIMHPGASVTCQTWWFYTWILFQRDARIFKGQILSMSNDSYNMEDIVMPLHQYIHDPIARDIIHNGATFQVLNTIPLLALFIFCCFSYSMGCYNDHAQQWTLDC